MSMFQFCDAALQRLMTEKCSVFRNNDGLKEALVEIRQLKKRYLNVGIGNKDKIFNYELQEALELREHAQSC